MVQRRRFLELSGLAASLGAVPGISLWPAAAHADGARPLVWGGTVPLKLDPQQLADLEAFLRALDERHVRMLRQPFPALVTE